MGLLNNALPFTLIVWGQHRIASGLAAILNAMTPLFTAVVAHLFTADEKLTPAKIIGVLSGICGVIAMIGPMALMGIGTETLAELACLGAALSYAFAGVFGRRFRRLGVTPLATATGQVTASAVTLLPIMIIVDRPWELAPPHVATWGAVLGIGMLSTAVAYVLYFKILEAAGATNLLLVTFLIPVTAILLGTYVLREHLLLRHLVGMGLIGTGLAVIDGRMLVLANRRLSAFAMLRIGFRAK
jgi:drug/metabolite transporter (DMT)-like permease